MWILSSSRARSIPFYLQRAISESLNVFGRLVSRNLGPVSRCSLPLCTGYFDVSLSRATACRIQKLAHSRVRPESMHNYQVLVDAERNVVEPPVFCSIRLSDSTQSIQDSCQSIRRERPDSRRRVDRPAAWADQAILGPECLPADTRAKDDFANPDLHRATRPAPFLEPCSRDSKSLRCTP